MIQVDPSHFSNVITTVQRTGSLPGGAVRGLPNGIVIDGLQGIGSVASDVADAQKEFRLGRALTALERVKQLATQFNGTASRWDSTVGSLISSARQGRGQLSSQKLNEAKNAQARMRQLTAPASKALQDLITALEHAVTVGQESPTTPIEEPANESSKQIDLATDSKEAPVIARSTVAAKDDVPDAGALGSFAANYRFGTKLQLERSADKKVHVVPKLEKDKFYFVAGVDPPRVIRVRELQQKAIIVFDTLQSTEATIDVRELSGLIKQGIWILV
jgi:hypothetical protein